MELLSHLLLHTALDIEVGGSPESNPLCILMPAEFSAPFLMYQLFALSALHLSHKNVAQAEKYSVEASYGTASGSAGSFQRNLWRDHEG